MEARLSRKKPLVFGGSARENNEVVAELGRVLLPIADLVPWWLNDTFKPGYATLDGLLAAASKFDFAIFVFAPDDVTRSRKKTFFTPRDNVVFEYGLFLGALGKDRTFPIVQNSNERPVKVPTDLLGIGIEPFTYANRENLTAALSALVRSKLEVPITQEGRRTFNLIESWDFLVPEQKFITRLNTSAMRRRSDALRDKSLLLVYRKRDPGRPLDLDDRIAFGALRPVNLQEPEVTLSASKSESVPNVGSGDKVECFLFLVPREANIEKCRTMANIKDQGCDLLDRHIGKEIK
jgi:hypothetical protein